MKERVKKSLFIFAAMNLVGAAVALFLESGLGCDSIGLLCDGISRAFRLSYGNASLAYNLTIILIAACAARRNLGAGTIVYALSSGYFIDAYRFLLAPLSLGEMALAARFLSFAAGQIFLCLALALLIQLKLGMNALDAVLCKLSERTRLPYAWLRTAADLSYVIAGILLGGVFGIGTILSVLLTGTMVKWFGLWIGQVRFPSALTHLAAPHKSSNPAL